MIGGVLLVLRWRYAPPTSPSLSYAVVARCCHCFPAFIYALTFSSFACSLSEGWSPNPAIFCTTASKTLTGATWDAGFNPASSATTYDSQSTVSIRCVFSLSVVTSLTGAVVELVKLLLSLPHHPLSCVFAPIHNTSSSSRTSTRMGTPRMCGCRTDGTAQGR